ncbi:GNAT family N-acetyltransferase [Streptosporangium sp. NBC_01755]|uniref:GNAT family N-acetyltransferase n=1 Tax=unclassified Streptosporangium TaxID=2632669 RepID=UPI002DDB46BE|nr:MULTISPECIES: GNAT family N-acetyltransferase [unclassified Streptosporangium]WSA27176.1 GNAT family N-acetyltransferase [Streptosporangium sp. NBC_01810]WSD01270.1 GNAT family N-acetyltransferase [Streptosporangium sp. NBC_01755]
MIDEVFDRLVDQAWPAIHRVDAGGWTPRAADKVTKRANAYASLGGKAVGRGVVQGEWFGIYSMAVVPHARRRGHGRKVLCALLTHAREQGTPRAYLVVVESNTVARTLYERHGFTVAARYHYRVR